jgi:hypothetical protein
MSGTRPASLSKRQFYQPGRQLAGVDRLEPETGGITRSARA